MIRIEERSVRKIRMRGAQVGMIDSKNISYYMSKTETWTDIVTDQLAIVLFVPSKRQIKQFALKEDNLIVTINVQLINIYLYLLFIAECLQ